MRSVISRWFLFGLLLGWALTHAAVFGQAPADKTASGPSKLRHELDKTITIDYTGQSLSETIKHFSDKAGVPIVIDQFTMLQMGVNAGDALGAVRVRGTNEKAGQILRKFLNSQQLTYVISEDSILVTTIDQAVSRQMRRRVSVDLEDVPFNKAVRELAKNHGINLVLDPKVAMPNHTPVSLHLDGTSIETAFRLLAELAGQKAVRMGNVVFITSEEKAKKIREEELHQFDNPINPNSPSAASLTFGFGGIGPVPARAIVTSVAPGGLHTEPIGPLEKRTDSPPVKILPANPSPPPPPPFPPSSVERPTFPMVPPPRK